MEFTIRVIHSSESSVTNDYFNLEEKLKKHYGYRQSMRVLNAVWRPKPNDYIVAIYTSDGKLNGALRFAVSNSRHYIYHKEAEKITLQELRSTVPSGSNKGIADIYGLIIDPDISKLEIVSLLLRIALTALEKFHVYEVFSETLSFSTPIFEKFGFRLYSDVKSKSRHSAFKESTSKKSSHLPVIVFFSFRKTRMPYKAPNVEISNLFESEHGTLDLELESATVELFWDLSPKNFGNSLDDDGVNRPPKK